MCFPQAELRRIGYSSLCDQVFGLGIFSACYVRFLPVFLGVLMIIILFHFGATKRKNTMFFAVVLICLPLRVANPRQGK
jgi:hypothetical protein